MALLSTVDYQGNLRTQAVHLQSNNTIITDAPVDNHGKGEAFSPTDLLATSLASCMLTIMGIKANDLQIDLTGTHATVTKVMESNPRRVSEVHITITLPDTVANTLDEHACKLLQKVALACPVAQSLHPQIKQVVQFTNF